MKIESLNYKRPPIYRGHRTAGNRKSVNNVKTINDRSRLVGTGKINTEKLNTVLCFRNFSDGINPTFFSDNLQYQNKNLYVLFLIIYF